MLLDRTVLQHTPPVISRGIIIVAGSYGSGKSEISVNLARHFITSRSDPADPVAIADLDIVNPYFRSREAAAELERLGIRPVNPEGELFYAELPIILPEIKGAIEQNRGKVVLDVGGDDTGARVLNSLANALKPGIYELLFVLNANRPFTSTVEGCRRMLREIEDASGLKFTGIVSNTHLLEHTTEQTVLMGLKLARQVSNATGLPILFLCVLRHLLEKIDPELINVPVLPLDRSLLKPWERT